MRRKAKLTPESTPMTPRSPAGGQAVTSSPVVPPSCRSSDSNALLNANAHHTSAEMENSEDNPREEIMHDEDMPAMHHTIAPGGGTAGALSAGSQKRSRGKLAPSLYVFLQKFMWF